MLPLGFGTYKLSNDQAYFTVGLALKHGMRHIDTASLYRNERAVGQAVQDSDIPREEVFITTKIKMVDMSFDRMKHSIKQSLENLGGRIDLLLLHGYQSLQAWQNLVTLADQHQPHIRHIGVSNYSVPHLQEIISVCATHPWANQIEFSPFFKRFDIVEFCHQHQIQVVAHSLLGGRVRKWGLAPQLTLQWCWQHDITPLFGTTSEAHLVENVKPRALLSSTEMDFIDQIEQQDILFPQHVI